MTSSVSMAIFFANDSNHTNPPKEPFDHIYLMFRSGSIYTIYPDVVICYSTQFQQAVTLLNVYMLFIDICYGRE